MRGPAGFANYTLNYSSTGGRRRRAGYNYQSGNIVLGVEGDYSWSDIKGNDNFGSLTRFQRFERPDRLDVGPHTSGARRHRGRSPAVVLHRWLGLWRAASHQHRLGNGCRRRSTVNRSGLTAGGGIAYAITNNVIGKFEYRYYDFGTYSRAGGATGLTSNGQLPYKVANTYSDVLLGLDFKFGGR
jgi:outer membrane immunogenic protein